MKKVLTENEIKANLKNMEIIVDTREQKNEHILEYFNEKGIKYIKRKLDTGDYSFQVGKISYADEIVIEKKNSLDELAQGFASDRDRFKNEFLRARANGTKVFLFVENASWVKLKNGDYRSQIKPQSLMGSLLSWQVRYNITVNFVEREIIPELISATLYYHAKQRLE